MSERKPKVLWILMHRGTSGWIPSMDHFCAWSTKKAANGKISRLNDRGLGGLRYKAFKYVLEGK